MDDTDQKLLLALRKDARQSLSLLAADIGVSRATVRARLDRLISDGEILGFTTVLQSDLRDHAVRGLMMLGIEGRGTARIIHRLNSIPAVEKIHSTNGKWDLVVEIGTETLEALDRVLVDVRQIEGVMTSETSLLLATRRAV